MDDVFIVGGGHLAGLIHMAQALVEDTSVTANRAGTVFADCFGVNSEQRRCFHTDSSPSLFPCRPQDEDAVCGSLPVAFGGPKIAVFCADPRYELMSELENNDDTSDQLTKDALVRHAVEDESGKVRAVIKDICEWAAAEQDCPEQVRIFFVEDFVFEPEVAIGRLAQFLEVYAFPLPTEQLLSHIDMDGLAADRCVREFRRHLARLPNSVTNDLHMALSPWLQSANPQLATLAEQMLQGPAPAIVDWEPAHATGACDPCLFAMRNACRNGDSCAYCHLPGHRKPKRASKRKRDQKKERLSRACRTPSPEWRSSDSIGTDRILPTLPAASLSWSPVLPLQPALIPVAVGPCWI